MGGKYKTVYIEEWVVYDEFGNSDGDGWIDEYKSAWENLTDFFEDQDEYGWELVTLGWTENSFDDEYDGYYAVFRR